MTLALAIALIAVLAAYRRIPIPFWAGAVALSALLTLTLTPSTSDAVVALFAVLLAMAVGLRPLRLPLISRPLFQMLRTLQPAEPDEPDDDRWGRELMAGKPRWRRLLGPPAVRLTEFERQFLAGPCRELCASLDEQSDPNDPAVWNAIAASGVAGLTLPRSLGGPGLSWLASHRAVEMVASRSPAVAAALVEVTALGPATLIALAGTETQKQELLPTFASGKRVGARARAVAFPDLDDPRYPTAQISESDVEPATVTVTWHDFEVPHCGQLDDIVIFGSVSASRLICLLVPAEKVRFRNSGRAGERVCSAEAVTVAADRVIGGLDFDARKLLEHPQIVSFAAGASAACMLGAGKARLGAITAYARLARWRNVPLHRRPHCQATIAEAAVETYRAQAMIQHASNRLGHQRSSLPSLLARWAASPLPRASNARPLGDVHARTIELDRFHRRGVIGNHPFWLRNVHCIVDADPDAGLSRFDRLLWAHIGLLTSNVVRAIVLGLSNGLLTRGPSSSRVNRAYRQLARYSAAVAAITDSVVIMKRCKFIDHGPCAQKLALAYANLYVATCVLRRFQEDGEPMDDLALIHLSHRSSCRAIEDALRSLLTGIGGWATLMKWAMLPPGVYERGDEGVLAARVTAVLVDDRPSRTRLLAGRFAPGQPDDHASRLELALRKVIAAQAGELAIANAMGVMVTPDNADELTERGVRTGILTEDQARLVAEAQQAIRELLR